LKGKGWGMKKVVCGNKIKESEFLEQPSLIWLTNFTPHKKCMYLAWFLWKNPIFTFFNFSSQVWKHFPRLYKKYLK
jgi:hypothetical protein